MLSASARQGAGDVQCDLNATNDSIQSASLSENADTDLSLDRMTRLVRDVEARAHERLGHRRGNVCCQ